MYRLGSNRGVNEVFFHIFEMFFLEHALSRQNKALKDSRKDSRGGCLGIVCVKKVNIYVNKKTH